MVKQRRQNKSQKNGASKNSQRKKSIDKNSNLISAFVDENSKCSEYYEKHLALLEAYKYDDECIKNGGPAEDKEEAAKADQFISTVVLLVNIGLLLAKAFSTWITHGSSLSIISTLLDSVVDIASGFAVWYATHLIINTDKYDYPRGRENLQNIALLFLSILMFFASLQVIKDSCVAIIYGKAPPDITFVSFLILFGTILIKMALYAWCRKRKSKNAEVLASDQRNDVLTNAVVILGAILSEYAVPIFDPITALIVSSFIAYNWFELLQEQMHQIMGGVCSQQEISRITRVCISEPRVRCLDALLAYHSGNKVRVEVHVVVDPNLPLKQIHDEVIEPLTTKLESLVFVDKAFVHPDHTLDGQDK